MSTSWRCPVCETTNTAGATRCVVCERERADAPAGPLPGQTGRSADDPANEVPVPQTVTMFTSPDAPVSAPAPSPATSPAPGAVPAGSTPKRTGILIGLIALVAVVAVAAVAFKLGSSSTIADPPPTTSRPDPVVSIAVPGSSAPVVTVPATAETVVTAPPTVATVAVLPPPTVTTTTTSAPPAPGVGTIVGTCDEGTSCGTFVRSSPKQSASPLSKTALQDGQVVNIACSVTGDVRTSGSTTSDVWYRLTTGGYVASVFVFTHSTVVAC